MRRSGQRRAERGRARPAVPARGGRAAAHRPGATRRNRPHRTPGGGSDPQPHRDRPVHRPASQGGRRERRPAWARGVGRKLAASHLPARPSRERCSACAVRITPPCGATTAPFGGRPTRSDCLQLPHLHRQRYRPDPAATSSASRVPRRCPRNRGRQGPGLQRAEGRHPDQPLTRPETEPIEKTTAHRSEALENIVAMLFRAQAAGAATPEITVEVSASAYDGLGHCSGCEASARRTSTPAACEPSAVGTRATPVVRLPPQRSATRIGSLDSRRSMLSPAYV